MRPSIPLLRRPSAANGDEALETAGPPEPARLDSGGEPAAPALRDTDEVEDGGRPAAASGRNGDGEPDWRDRFDTAEEMYQRFVNVDRFRGRQATEIGKLRRQLRLAARLYDDALTQQDPVKALAADTALKTILNPAAPEQFVETFERLIDREERDV